MLRLYVFFAPLAFVALVFILRIIWLWWHGWIYLGYGFITEYDEKKRQVYIASRLWESPAGRVSVPLGQNNVVRGIPIGAEIIEWNGVSFEDLSEQEYRERIKRCAARHWRQKTTLRLRDVYSGTFMVTMKSFLNTTSIPVYERPQHSGDPRYECSVYYDSKIGSTYYVERFIPDDGPPGCD